MDATTVAIDLAKDVFELVFADPQGRIVERNGTPFDGDHVSVVLAVH